jgi:6-phosphogluconolactonase
MRLLSCLLLFFLSNNTFSQNIPLYVGGYTNGESEGIYQFQFNTETGELSDKKLIGKTDNPSYIVLAPKKDFLYTVAESGEKSGKVIGFKILEDGSLEKISEVSSNGKHPCHLDVNKKGTKLVVSNYTGGNFSIIDVENGVLNEANQIVTLFRGEDKAHTHSAQFHKNELFVADLGINTFEHYTYNKEKNRYNSFNTISMVKKFGPRHFVLTKNKKFAYVINEYGGTVTTLKRNKGKFKRVNDVATSKEDYKGRISCADIHLSKNEKFLYGTTRGENTISVFKRDKKSGLLEQIQNTSTHGNWPRNFTIDPTGKFILVANKISSNICVFSIDKKTGKLTFINEFESANPSCLKF